jgi:hypothetical protein
MNIAPIRPVFQGDDLDSKTLIHEKYCGVCKPGQQGKSREDLTAVKHANHLNEDNGPILPLPGPNSRFS